MSDEAFEVQVSKDGVRVAGHPHSFRWAPASDLVGRGSGWVHSLSRRSGVYLIRGVGGRLLYVGESHTGKLWRTLRRHFWEWTGHGSGETYDPDRSMFAAVLLPAELVEGVQYAIAAELRPRDSRRRYTGGDGLDDRPVQVHEIEIGEGDALEIEGAELVEVEGVPF